MGLFFEGETRSPSSAAGLNCPPLRSWDREERRVVCAFESSASRVVRSKGSISGSEPDLVLVEVADLASSRAALPPFLRRWGVVLKAWTVGGREIVLGRRVGSSDRVGDATPVVLWCVSHLPSEDVR